MSVYTVTKQNCIDEMASEKQNMAWFGEVCEKTLQLVGDNVTPATKATLEKMRAEYEERHAAMEDAQTELEALP